MRTTTDMSPAQIHELGLSEVARIHGEIRKVMAEVGFKGSLQDFFKFMQNDPRFSFKDEDGAAGALPRAGSEDQPEDPRAVLADAEGAVRDPPGRAVPRQVGGRRRIPEPERGRQPPRHLLRQHLRPADPQDLGRRGPVPARGHPGPPLPDRAAAGADRPAEVPSLRRRDRVRRRLGPVRRIAGQDLGVYTDPYDYFGYLQNELWRAIRLVTDTGLHSKDWTREQVIKYMLDNSAESETQATAEAERYVAWPGQALAYKIGELKIQQLRDRAEKELGDKFDVREFHAEVLKDGSVPLDVLEAKIDRWIASKQA